MLGVGELYVGGKLFLLLVEDIVDMELELSAKVGE